MVWREPWKKREKFYFSRLFPREAESGGVRRRFRRRFCCGKLEMADISADQWRFRRSGGDCGGTAEITMVRRIIIFTSRARESFKHLPIDSSPARKVLRAPQHRMRTKSSSHSMEWEPKACRTKIRRNTIQYTHKQWNRLEIYVQAVLPR